MILVTDASSILAAIFPDETVSFDLFETLKDAEIAVPSIWPAEIANSMLMGVRRNRLDREHAAEAIAWLSELEVEVVPKALGEVGTDIVPLANKHRLTVYDALYLDLARSRAATLVTIDQALVRAARLEGVEVA